MAAIVCKTLCLAARPSPARAVHRPRVPAGVITRSAPSEGVDVSGEWEAVQSLASQDEILLYYNHQHQPKKTRLHDVMQVNLVLCQPETSLAEVAALLDGPPTIEGLPVVDADKKLMGVISRKDLAKPGSVAQDVMSSPPVALKASGNVSDAASLMVERKFHRVPVVDDEFKCVGIVTRTDIFWALAQSDQEDDVESLFAQHGIDV